MDDLDHRLIALLRANGREPVIHLAERLKVARATVNTRISRLVESGVITGFSVKVRDPSASSAVNAIMLISVESRNASEIFDSLHSIPQILALHTTNGRWDIILEIRCDDLVMFDTVLSTIRGIGGVRYSETNLLLRSQQSADADNYQFV